MTPPPPLLALPYELRRQIWTLALGPTQVHACKCHSTPGKCTSKHAGVCCEALNAYKIFDNRFLRVCRQIHDEVRPLLNSPPRFNVCSGLCMESLFLGIQPRHRRWIKHVRVYVYIGDASPEALNGQSGPELVHRAEASCGRFVQSALKFQGVGRLLDASSVREIEVDDVGRRKLCVDLTLG
ncbi:hypothetical protein AYO21_09212 [Fonsecaea monophora]|uniref:2EXR domain-containing protein n=1 Tax=Fonsecaea monophora TaxID=254056 RepID=A0A177EX00_9EURO|nr:hypothetical protein AYO21_09212 [Fonsecaea monophora]KAH0837718.1 hypothetical protein FOPE_05219 [Fonsecaea pedrosoi]OAG36555.1 hypothetical protein AYO21_09212 [Fonsecaea monophora]